MAVAQRHIIVTTAAAAAATMLATLVLVSASLPDGTAIPKPVAISSFSSTIQYTASFVGGNPSRWDRTRRRQRISNIAITHSLPLFPLSSEIYKGRDTTSQNFPGFLNAQKGESDGNFDETSNPTDDLDKDDSYVLQQQQDEEEEQTEQSEEEAEREALLNQSIDSFLRGEYDRPFADDAAAPHPGLGPGDVVDAALRSLRALDDPEPCHGAAVMLRFTAPLSRGERWGGGTTANPWKEVLRGALTPTMFARRIRASQFSGLLDWERLDVTEGLSIPTTRWSSEQLGVGSTVAFVNAAMFFGDGVEPYMIQFRLRKIAGVWLIDDAMINKTEWFVDDHGSEEEEY